MLRSSVGRLGLLRILASSLENTPVIQNLTSLRHLHGHKYYDWSGVTPGSEIDLNYVSPTDAFYQEPIKHKKFTRRVEDALVAAIERDGVLLHALVQQKGFTICEVRVRGDKRVVYVQWNCFPKFKRQTEVELNACMKRLRANFGKFLGARHLPRLEFFHDSLNAKQREVDNIFKELEAEEDRDALERATLQAMDEFQSSN